MEAVVPADCVKDYFLYKAFDIISNGSYKKLVVKNKETNEQWAVTLYAKVQKMTGVIKAMLHQVDCLHEYGKTKLQTVCAEVLAHVNPPCKIKSCWNTCFISGIRSSDCLDLTRPGRSETIITVHRKFSHFILMLWFVAKFEHVCKAYTRKWLAEQGAEHLSQTSVHELCTQFERENKIFDALYAAFLHAHAHVTQSLQRYRQIPCYETHGK